MFFILFMTMAVVAASQDQSNSCSICLHRKCYKPSSTTGALQTIAIAEPVRAVINYNTSSLYCISGFGLKVFELPSFRDDTRENMWFRINYKAPFITTDQVTGELYYKSSRYTISKYDHESLVQRNLSATARFPRELRELSTAVPIKVDNAHFNTIPRLRKIRPTEPRGFNATPRLQSNGNRSQLTDDRYISMITQYNRFYHGNENHKKSLSSLRVTSTTSSYRMREEESDNIYHKDQLSRIKIFPHKLWVFNGTMYFTEYKDNKIEKGLNFFKRFPFKRIPALENSTVHDIVFDTSGTLFIKSEAQIYKLIVSKGPSELTPIGGPIDPEKILLSGSKNGTIYVLDSSNKQIYIVDPATDQLQNVGSLRDRLTTIEIKQLMIDPRQNVMLVVRDNEKTVFEYYWKTDDDCQNN